MNPNPAQKAPASEPLREELIEVWNTDAPAGKCWKCPNCEAWATLGGNAAFHAQNEKHGKPTLWTIPAMADERIGAQNPDALVIAFIQGAKWWEWTRTGATMWPAYQSLAEDEAKRRLQRGRLGTRTP